MQLDKKLASIFEKLRESYAIGQDSKMGHAQNFVERNSLVPLMYDMSGFFAINATGTILAFSFDDLDHPTPVVESRLVNTILKQGSRTFPELDGLLPRRPDNSKDCSYCLGTGVAPAARLLNEPNIVCFCGGLGWIPE